VRKRHRAQTRIGRAQLGADEQSHHREPKNHDGGSKEAVEHAATLERSALMKTPILNAPPFIRPRITPVCARSFYKESVTLFQDRI
jgi:hypothetical protein